MLRRLLATWGNADFGRLGHGAIESQMLPRVVEVLKEENIVQVSSGGAHTAAVAADGSLYTFGLNDFGQLGHSQGEAFCEVPREVLVPESVVSVSWGTTTPSRSQALGLWEELQRAARDREAQRRRLAPPFPRAGPRRRRGGGGEGRRGAHARADGGRGGLLVGVQRQREARPREGVLLHVLAAG
eukprot:CAMPEP_0177607112 /NCGR_PEP_ID=MMETSP0419_2-20121207/17728_1 /TAXON_ID=582737 /ORGANISM="Tetraselmis sp., Strain GSL018" /LENGTH=184 /DNA_ID=CAMNT_0019101641 /DNA_START=193 /DNA_END=745 /DNA_ORIENTATION=-